MNSEFIMTVNLVLPFVIITDFITMLIYKRFNPLKIAFYIRLYTMMVLIYVAVVANLIVFLFQKKEATTKDEIESKVEEPALLETKETILSIDLESLTITTLKGLAKSKGIEGYTSLDKEEIIKLLK